MMRGIGWDDMGRGTKSLLSERKFYDRLQESLSEIGIKYSVEEDFDNVFQKAMSGKYDFVTVDLIGAESLPVGADYVRQLRQGFNNKNEYGFPIFMLSSTPEDFPYKEANANRVTVLQKSNAPSATAHSIEHWLRHTGRYRSKEVVIFARHATVSLSGEALDRSLLEELSSIVTAEGLDPHDVTPDKFSLDIIDELKTRILNAGKVFVLMTADEKLNGQTDTRLARPNVYTELGIVLGVPGGDKKLTILQQDGVYLPSDVGGRVPIRFSDTLVDIREEIKTVLESVAR